MSHRAPVLLVLLILLLLPLSGSAASSFGPEVAVTPPVPTLSSTFQLSPAAAPNGDGFLAAWWDARAYPGIYAGRLEANGNVVDQRDLFVTPKQGAIAMTALGRDTLLAVATCGAIDVFRIDESNAITDSTTFGTNSQLCFGDLSMATNGETIVLAYAGDVSVLDPDLNLVSQASIDAAAVYGAVATDGRDYVVVTAAVTPLAKTTHLDHRGAVIEANGIVFPNRVESLSIASTGTDYLAVAGGPVLGAVHLAAGGAQVGVEKSVQIATPIRGASRPRIAWGGSAYVITYNQQPQLSSSQVSSVLRVDADAQPLTTRVLGAVSSTALAVRPGRALVTSTVVGATAQAFDADTLAPLGDAKRISYTTADQFLPKLLDAGGTLIAFWVERTFDGQSLKAKPLTDGATETTLTGGASSRYSAVFDGTNIILVFEGLAGTVTIRRFRPDLTPIDEAGLTFGSTSSVFQSVAAAGDGRLLIAWVEAGTNVFEVRTRMYDTTGPSLVHLNTSTVSLPPHSSEWPAVAWNGTDFVVMWAHATEEPSIISLAPPPPDELLARRIARDGTLIDAAPVLVANPKSDVSWTALASNGGRFYGAWTQRDPANGRPVVAGKVLDSNDDPDILGGNIDIAESVAPFGDGFVVAWGAPNADFSAYSPTLRLIDAAGSPGPTFALPLMPKISTVSYVTFASGTLAYVRAGTAPELGGALRLFTRTFSPAGRRRASAS